MGLIYFSFVMIMGHMSFVRPEWLQRLGAWWKRRIGVIEMIYDSRSSHGLRSAAWLLSFDGLQQIALREIQTVPPPAAIDGRPDKGPWVVLPGGRTLAGFDAYRHIVPRVPGLWWLVPLFHVPVVSRLLVRPIYDWVAASRRWLSTAAFPLLPRAEL
jgi:predicted DCC family thiol-disulfide oxidoreductase YuxK